MQSCWLTLTLNELRYSFSLQKPLIVLSLKRQSLPRLPSENFQKLQLNWKKKQRLCSDTGKTVWLFYISVRESLHKSLTKNSWAGMDSTSHCFMQRFFSGLSSILARRSMFHGRLEAESPVSAGLGRATLGWASCITDTFVSLVYHWTWLSNLRRQRQVSARWVTASRGGFSVDYLASVPDDQSPMADLRPKGPQLLLGHFRVTLLWVPWVALTPLSPLGSTVTCCPF